jgi:signal transduction histidine kinase
MERQHSTTPARPRTRRQTTTHQLRSQLARLQRINQELANEVTRIRQRTLSAERDRLIRDLHDTFGQYFPLLNILLGQSVALLDIDLDQARAELIKAHTYAATGRDLLLGEIHDLRARSASIEEALHLPVDLARLAGVDTVLSLSGKARPLPEVIEQAILFVTREALANVVRHSGAEFADVGVIFEAERVQLIIEDDGHGTMGTTEGHGLGNMQARAHEIGGTLTITATPGKGCCITLEVSL